MKLQPIDANIILYLAGKRGINFNDMAALIKARMRDPYTMSDFFWTSIQLRFEVALLSFALDPFGLGRPYSYTNKAKLDVIDIYRYIKEHHPEVSVSGYARALHMSDATVRQWLIKAGEYKPTITVKKTRTLEQVSTPALKAAHKAIGDELHKRDAKQFKHDAYLGLI